MEIKTRDSFQGLLTLSMWCVFVTGVVGFFIGFPEMLFGKYDPEGNLLKDNSIFGDYIKLLGTLIGILLVALGLWINNTRVKEQTRQNNIAEKSQINTRFKDAATLLASDNTSANLSGIYALHQVALESSKDKYDNYYIKVVHDILCAFIRENSVIEKTTNFENSTITKAEVLKPTIVFITILNILFRNDNNIYKNLNSDLSFSVLKGFTLSDLCLNHVDLNNSLIYRVTFNNCDFENVECFETNFSSVNFQLTNFNVVNFIMCKFRQVSFNIRYVGILKAKHAYLENVSFLNSEFIYGKFAYVIMKNVSFYGTKLLKVDYNNAIFEKEVDFSNSTLNNYTLEEINSQSLDLTSSTEFPFA